MVAPTLPAPITVTFLLIVVTPFSKAMDTANKTFSYGIIILEIHQKQKLKFYIFATAKRHTCV